ncbi:MAG TPA: aspartate--tRNA(Asn) ligase [Candidatus Saccharimonadales bacterium]|nr:aspartate--tRNA(Asn) ligase [Candidatus Saccharimonadales bacterium]
MRRILSSDVVNHAGKQVKIRGWLHKKRMLGGLNFINVRDRAGLVQILVEDKDEVEKLRGMQIGTVLSIEGEAAKDDRAPNGMEIHHPKLIIEVPVLDEPPIEIDKPLTHKPDNLDTLFEHRPLGLRNLREAAIFKVQAKVLEAFREYFSANDFTEMNSPKLLAEATEGGAEVFKLDYFGRTATLAQSAQFYKQIMVGVYERVFETNPTYRAEPSATTRHMTEYITIDAEIGFIEFEDLLEHAGACLISVISKTEKDCKKELKAWNTPPFKLPRAAKDIPRYDITEVHEMFARANKENHSDEDDLAPAEERWICEYAKKSHGSEAVFITGWSTKSKTFKFYHRANEKNPELADRADLLFRGVEIATLSMRENRYDKLIAQLKATGGDPTNPGYAPLLSVYKYGMPPHGGWGWGLERTVEKILNLNSVKEATLFPRDMNRLTP